MIKLRNLYASSALDKNLDLSDRHGLNINDGMYVVILNKERQAVDYDVGLSKATAYNACQTKFPMEGPCAGYGNFFSTLYN